LVIAEPSVPVEEEELPPRVRDMDYDIEMEAEVPERQEVSERLRRSCQKENEPCVIGSWNWGWSRCCNTDQECQVCKTGSKWCIFDGFCIPCLGTGLKATCQPKAATTPLTTTVTTVITSQWVDPSKN